MPYKVAAAASEMLSLDQSPWQRACIDGSAWINRRANAFGLVCFVIGGAVGASLLTSSSLLVRLVEGGLAGLGAWVIVNVVVYGVQTALAVCRQRKEARLYACELETYAEAYAEWRMRRDIAYDFRHRILMEELPRIRTQGLWMGSLADEEERWRSIVGEVRSQMEQHGADASVFERFDIQMRDFESKNDSYGDRERDRLIASMSNTSVNVWALVVQQQEPPTLPAPPAAGDQ